VLSAVADRHLNRLALLVLATDIGGIGASFVTGDPRLLVAKNSIISSIVAVGIIVSVMRGEPVMSAGLQPFLTKGDPARATAWEHLAATSATFARYQRRYSLIWGVFLLVDCVARTVGAFTLPVATMSWLGTVFIVVAVAAAVVVSGGVAASPLDELMTAEVARSAGGGDAELATS
jgi:hypothetical protein